MCGLWSGSGQREVGLLSQHPAISDEKLLYDAVNDKELLFVFMMYVCVCVSV